MDYYLGIDISKASFDAYLIGPKKTKHRTFTNNAAGFNMLSDWLRSFEVDVVHACMEATGRYWEHLAEHLYQTGHQVSAINPARIKGFSQSLLSRLKTDKADAEIIALFCQALKPRLWKPLATHSRELQELVRHQSNIRQTMQREKNRLQFGITSASLIKVLEDHVQFLTSQLEELEQRIKELVASNQELSSQCVLLLSIPGVGLKTALSFLSEIGEVANFSSTKQLVAYAGLAPSEKSSGSSIRKHARISKIGNSRLRKALYFPAMVAEVSNPTIAEFSSRLKLSGLKPMPRIIASMRKLLHIMFGVLKNKTVFRPIAA